jgi:hypothetical protein
MRTGRHQVLGTGLLCGIAVLATWGGRASAAPIAMPAESTVWMHFEAGACPDADGDDCIGSNLIGVAPPNGIPLTTLPYPGYDPSVYAEVLPDRVRSSISVKSAGAFLRCSFEDTYTVHGSAAGSFPVTVTVAAAGTASTVNLGAVPSPERLVGANVNVEIGTFDHSPVAEPEQFRVTPFDATTTATQSFPTTVGNSPASLPVSVSTSGSVTTSVGSTFTLAYGVNSAMSTGKIDLTSGGATISFALPEGVWLTSTQGGVFGQPAAPQVPLPAFVYPTTALALAGLARRAARRSL